MQELKPVDLVVIGGPLVVEISPPSGENYAMFPRNISRRLASAMTDTPVVLLSGARQTGKTTLVREVAAKAALPYVTLDDVGTLSAATADRKSTRLNSSH